MTRQITAPDTTRLREISNRAGRVQARTVEPGTDHEAYELSRDVQYLLIELHEMRQAHSRAVEDYNALRRQVLAAGSAEES